jgi:choline dehydrogenase-like flavoprotein
MHGARILPGFEVDRLNEVGGRIVGVCGRHGGQELDLRARFVILAAGALATPLILLRSATAAWPDGVGNNAGMVGRGLMFHFAQVFVLWPKRALPSWGPAKTLSTRVLNTLGGRRLGGAQSLAPRISVGNIADFLTSFLTFEGQSGLSYSLAKATATAMALIGAWLFRGAALFATETEDFAYPENRVVLDTKSASGFRIVYSPTRDLMDRATILRKELRKRLRSQRLLFLTRARPTLNFGHPAGTCRAGSAPQTSVVDPDCRVWGTDNLYIADASFLPSIAATNPGLTVAANALRVADLILARTA